MSDKVSKKRPKRARKVAPRAVAQAAVATVLVLRTCGEDGSSYGGKFKWPLEVGAVVEAPDWQPTPSCGHGLHGLKWGAGDPTSAWHWEAGAKWLVVEVTEADLVEIDRKVKYPRCKIVHVGDQQSATAFIAERAPAGTPIVGGTATAGYRGTATAGYRGTATAGDRGTATAGDRGTATAGYRGTATAGDRGTATAGYGGTIVIEWWDPAKEKYRRLLGEIGEDGLEPNVSYRVAGGRFVRVDAVDDGGAGR